MTIRREDWGLGDVACRAIAGAGRLLLGLALILFPLALALGRAGRPDPPPPLIDRGDLPIRVGPRPHEADRFLDPETGRAVVPSIPAGGEVRGSAWAPWADGCGRTQLVILWRGSDFAESALLRLSQPDGTVLDRLPAADLPGWGVPCWFPDRSPRILLPGYDGVLYRVDFDGPDAGSRATRPLAWRAEPATGVARLGDLAWPRHPRLGGCILASLVARAKPGTPPRPDIRSIWWLRLDPEAAAVIAAGPLIRRAGSVADVDERHPALSPAGAGPPALAWLERPWDRRGEPWRLRVAPVEVDPRSGEPSASAERARAAAEGCELVAPAFSADGRRISFVVAGGGPLEMRRVDATGPAGP